MSDSFFPGYASTLEALKQKIQAAQLKAALSVNAQLIDLYWEMGQTILQQQGWGAKVIDRLSKDLRKAFPEMKGFSPRNLKYMRAFAEGYPDRTIVQQPVAQIPWGHNVMLLDKTKDHEQRLWYAQKVVEHGWSRNILALQIEGELFHRQGKALTNFERTLPHSNLTWPGRR